MVVGLNGGALIPSRTRKLQIGQILRRLPNFRTTPKLIQQDKIDLYSSAGLNGHRGSKGGLLGSEGVKG